MTTLLLPEMARDEAQMIHRAAMRISANGFRTVDIQMFLMRLLHDAEYQRKAWEATLEVLGAGGCDVRVVRDFVRPLLDANRLLVQAMENVLATESLRKKNLSFHLERLAEIEESLPRVRSLEERWRALLAEAEKPIPEMTPEQAASIRAALDSWGPGRGHRRDHQASGARRNTLSRRS